jgi:hypothetical protein
MVFMGSELTWATLIEFWVAPGTSKGFSDTNSPKNQHKMNTLRVEKTLPPAIYSTLPLLDNSSYLRESRYEVRN